MTNENYDEKVLEEPGISKTKSSKSRKLRVVLVVLVLCVTALFIYNIFKPLNPSKLFRRFVLDPIPASVTNIKADQPVSVRGYEYVLLFNINREDLNRIVKSRPFREAQLSISKDGGYIFWEWKGWKDLPKSGHMRERGGGFPVYSYPERKPSWYTLESWDNPELYLIVPSVPRKKNEPDNQYLIYNAGLGQAFFIVFRYW